MKKTRCGECGAVLKDRPDTCPLCGQQVSLAEVPPPPDADDYQARVRELRGELKRLRERGAEAV